MQDLSNFIIPCGSGHFKKEFVKFCARTRRIGKIARNERHGFRAKKLQSGAECGILKIVGMHNGFRPAARPPAPEPEAAAASSQTDHPDAPEKQLNSHQKRKREDIRFEATTLVVKENDSQKGGDSLIVDHDQDCVHRI